MTITETDKVELAALAELDSRPSAPARVVRSSGQGLTAYVVLDAAQAFGWAGVDTWNEAQTRAGMALAFAVIASVQNLGPVVWRAMVGWWKSTHPGK